MNVFNKLIICYWMRGNLKRLKNMNIFKVNQKESEGESTNQLINRL